MYVAWFSEIFSYYLWTRPALEYCYDDHKQEDMANKGSCDRRVLIFLSFGFYFIFHRKVAVSSKYNYLHNTLSLPQV